jgi:hypothetical protein
MRKVFEICMNYNHMPLTSNNGCSLGFKSESDAIAYATGAGLKESEYIITFYNTTWAE